MQTQIFKTRDAFDSREDRTLNGVSPEFAKRHADYQHQNETNSDCYDCYRCSGCSGCSDCSDCYRCSGCYGCSDCYDCYDCSRCSDKSPQGKKIAVPIIPNIHKAVLESVSKPAAFDMSYWHSCKTTHCRAGWIVVLAGEAGKKLEAETSTCFAAMQIYAASSKIKVSPVRFYEDTQTALADIQRCAKEESQHSDLG